MPSGEEVIAMINQFDELFAPDGAGKRRLEFPKLVEFVRNNTEGSLAMTVGFVKASEVDEKYLQRAILLATAYEKVTEDDSARRYVERAIEKLGARNAMPTVEKTTHDNRRIIMLDVSSAMLQDLDFYSFLKIFSLRHNTTPEARERLRDFAGTCVLNLLGDEDPRRVWLVSECRVYIQHLHQALPYFPYYLVSDPRADALVEYFLCLMPEAAIDPQRGVDIRHESFLEIVSDSMSAIEHFCKEIGIDSDPSVDAIVDCLKASIAPLTDEP